MPKSLASDPKIARRTKLIAQLEQQRALALDDTYRVERKKWIKQPDGSRALIDAPKRVKRWWRADGTGIHYLILRYGNKLISLNPDKAAIAVGDRSKLVEVIDAVIAAAKAGELDSAIDSATNEDKKAKRKAA